jgi:predicted nucleotidyltransferase
MNKTREEIEAFVRKQVAKKMAVKKGYRKKVKVILDRGLRMISRAVLSNDVKIKPCPLDSSMGCDELGRDVEDGIRKYIEILKSRGIDIETVIALGSRVKGSWKPESDVDVTIIANNLPNEGKNAISRRIHDLKIKVSLSDRPICMGIEPSGCCSPRQFLEKLEHFDIQELDAVLYGKVIYDTGFWRTALDRYKAIEKKYHLSATILKTMLKNA